jgi:hypothetical protein
MLAAAGCGGLVRQATAPLVDNLSRTIQCENDPQLVRDGSPTLMLLVESFVNGNPDDPGTLAAAAQMYSAYTTAFVAAENPERAKLLSEKAKNYAFRAVSLKNKEFARRNGLPFADFEPVLATFKKEDAKDLFLIVSVWATWIQTHADDWNAVADLAKVQALTQKLVELDGNYYYGAPHLYMAVLYTFLPPALGGRMDDGRREFEAAIKAADGRFLPTYVYYAKQVALTLLDKDLFDRLIRHVRETPADIVPELTLVNTLAKKDAEKLAVQAKDYFATTE